MASGKATGKGGKGEKGKGERGGSGIFAGKVGKGNGKGTGDFGAYGGKGKGDKGGFYPGDLYGYNLNWYKGYKPYFYKD